MPTALLYIYQSEYADMQELAAYLAGLAEINSFQADESSREALLATAGAFSAMLDCGMQCRPTDLCKVRSHLHHLKHLALCMPPRPPEFVQTLSLCFPAYDLLGGESC